MSLVHPELPWEPGPGVAHGLQLDQLVQGPGRVLEGVAACRLVGDEKDCQ